MEQQEKPSFESILNSTNLADLIGAMSNSYAKKLSLNDKASVIDRSDLYNEGMLAAIKAYETFDHTRNVSFITYAYHFIYRAMNRHCGKFCHQLSTPYGNNSLRDQAVFDNLNNVKIVNIEWFGAPRRVNRRYEDITPYSLPSGTVEEVIDDCLGGYSKEEQDMVYDRLIAGHTYSEIAKKNNLGVSTTTTKVNHLIDILKNKIENG